MPDSLMIFIDVFLLFPSERCLGIADSTTDGGPATDRIKEDTDSIENQRKKDKRCFLRFFFGSLDGKSAISDAGKSIAVGVDCGGEKTGLMSLFSRGGRDPATLPHFAAKFYPFQIF